MFNFEEFFTNFNLWAYVKIAYLFGLSLYVIFAVIVLRQISLMTSTLNGTLNLPLKTLGYLHLIVALIVLALGFFIL